MSAPYVTVSAFAEDIQGGWWETNVITGRPVSRTYHRTFDDLRRAWEGHPLGETGARVMRELAELVHSVRPDRGVAFALTAVEARRFGWTTWYPSEDKANPVAPPNREFHLATHLHREAMREAER